MSQEKLIVTAPSDTELRLVRRFKAPRRLVFDAHTKPELVKRWLIHPDGSRLVVCDIDLRVGGRFRYEMSVRGGPETMGWGGEFLEITPVERIVHTELFDQDWTGGTTRVTMLFRETGPAETQLEMTVRYSSKDARDMAAKTGMTTGMEVAYANLDAIFAEIVTGRE